jgi:hypothetical protein
VKISLEKIRDMKRNNLGTTGLSLAIVSIVLDFISDMLKIEIPYVTILMILLGLVFLLILSMISLRGEKNSLNFSKL